MDQAPESETPPPREPSPEGRAPADDLACQVELPQFEGPLDLLLHLVRRHELDILDIPISFVCEKYLEYLEFMRALDLEVAGDYLVMAATLAWLKSRELVPRVEAEGEEVGQGPDDGPDPRAELIARLLEYQTYRAAADELDRLPVTGRDVFDRGAAVEVANLDAGLASVTLYRLAEAYHRVLERVRILKNHEVVLEQVSVSTRMEQLTMLLVERTRFDFEQLFLERTWATEQELRAMLIVTLMSVLELVRLGVARVHQPEGGDTLMIERAATVQEARQALASYDELASFGRPVPAEEEAEDDGDDMVAPAGVVSVGDVESELALTDRREAMREPSLFAAPESAAESFWDADADADANTDGGSDAEPADAEPADAEPADAEPADAEPADAEPVDAKPTEAEPADAEPVDAEPARADTHVGFDDVAAAQDADPTFVSDTETDEDHG